MRLSTGKCCLKSQIVFPTLSNHSNLNEAIELALVLEDGNQGGQKSSWNCGVYTMSTPNTSNQLSDVSKAKETWKIHMIKTPSGVKRKVSAMAGQAFNRCLLTHQQEDKAMRYGLCYGCMGQHEYKTRPKESKITANMLINPSIDVEEKQEEDQSLDPNLI